MIKNYLFAFLGFLLILAACRPDESISNIEENFNSKSLWEEDIKFINNVSFIFQSKFLTHQFKLEHGIPIWDYSMTMGHLDESFMTIPLKKNGRIKELLIFVRIKNKV